MSQTLNSCKALAMTIASALAHLAPIEHYDAALTLGDRIAVMRGGAIVAEFPGRAEPHAVMAAALGQSA